MHNIDRNMLETSFESEQFGPGETGNFEYQEYETPELGQETWSGEYQEFGYEAEAFGEAEAMELAAELLEVSNEQELEQFLGKLLRKVGVKLPSLKAVGGLLKGLAKKALPFAGTAVGGFFGGPIGAKIGGSLAQFASNALEFEALSQEDREFEGAKQFVKIAGQVARQVAASGPNTDLPAVRAALIQALRRNAPGLLQAIATGGQGNGSGGQHEAEYGYGSGSGSGGGGQSWGGTGASGSSHRGHSGRWMRRGSRIVLFGV
jgi:hypothetical protein